MEALFSATWETQKFFQRNLCFVGAWKLQIEIQWREKSQQNQGEELVFEVSIES